MGGTTVSALGSGVEGRGRQGSPSARTGPPSWWRRDNDNGRLDGRAVSTSAGQAGCQHPRVLSRRDRQVREGGRTTRRWRRAAARRPAARVHQHRHASARDGSTGGDGPPGGYSRRPWTVGPGTTKGRGAGGRPGARCGRRPRASTGGEQTGGEAARAAQQRRCVRARQRQPLALSQTILTRTSPAIAEGGQERRRIDCARYVALLRRLLDGIHRPSPAAAGTLRFAGPGAAPGDGASGGRAPPARDWGGGGGAEDGLAAKRGEKAGAGGARAWAGGVGGSRAGRGGGASGRDALVR